jgi:hypothetical protein
MFLILRTCRVDENQQKISRLFVSTDFGGVLKMHFGELKMRFFAKPSNSLSMVHTKLFEGFGG